MCPESWWALPPTFKRGKILKTFFTQIHMHERNQGHHKLVLLSKFQYWACLIYYVQEKKNIFLCAWCNKVFVTVWGKNCHFKTYLEYFNNNMKWHLKLIYPSKTNFFKWNFPTKYSFYILCYQKMILYLLRPLR